MKAKIHLEIDEERVGSLIDCLRKNFEPERKKKVGNNISLEWLYNNNVPEFERVESLHPTIESLLATNTQ